MAQELAPQDPAQGTQVKERRLTEGRSSMVEMVWEFVVKEEARGQFELAYGPGGAWSKLFAQALGFRGATLLRDTENLRRYLAIEVWDTGAQRELTLAERQPEYAALEVAVGDWTESATEVGVFTVRAEATVRPRGRAGRSQAGETRSRGRVPAR